MLWRICGRLYLPRQRQQRTAGADCHRGHQGGGEGKRRPGLCQHLRHWSSRASGLGREAVRPGDAVVVSGPVGCHGAAVMMARGELPCEGELLSDCMPLHALSRALIEVGGLRIMRDPTRGGLATTLNEFVEGLPFTIEISEQQCPSHPAFGWPVSFWFGPLYCACEGRIGSDWPERAELPWPLCGPCRAGRAQRRLAG